MSNSNRLGTVVKRIRALACAVGGSDARLLERFAVQGEEAAFDALLRRHAGMVLGVCRRVAGDRHDAEDAFQATFLLLAKKAGAIRRKEAVASWLHGVAFRVASKARTAMARRRQREKKAAQPERINPAQDAYADLKAELDEALQALPDKYRKALLLCYFEDRTLEEAASELGCPRGTVASRLAHGRELLRRRLARHGLPTAALTTFLLAECASAATAPALVKTTVAAGVQVAAGIAVEKVGPASVAALVHAGLRSALVPKAMALLAVLVVGIAGVAGVAGLAGPRDPDAPPPKTRAVEPATAVPAQDKPRTDSVGDPLPTDAISRIGNLRFRHGDHIRHLVFAPDSTMLISNGISGTYVWEAATGKEICHIAHNHYVPACDVSMDSKFIALPASPGNIIHLHDIKTGRHLRDITQTQPFRMVRFVPGGTELLTIDDKKIKSWNPATGKLLRELNGPGHVQNASPASFTSDGKIMAIATDDGTQLWDIAAGRAKQSIKPDHEVQSLSLSPDGKLLATLGYKREGGMLEGGGQWFLHVPEKSIQIWDTSTGKELRKVVAGTGKEATFHDVLFLPDGKTLIAQESAMWGDSETALRQWDATTGKELRRIPVDCYGLFDLACSQDGKMVATAAGALTIRLFDPQTGKDLAPPGGLQLSFHLMLSSDNRNLVTVSDRTLLVWDPETGALRRRLDVQGKDTAWADLARDGRTLVWSDRDGNVCVRDIVTGKELRRFKTPVGWPHVIALAADGQSMALTNWSETTTTLIVDTLTGKELKKIGDDKASSYRAFFIDAGKKLLVCTSEGILQSWSLTDGRKLFEFPLPKDRVDPFREPRRSGGKSNLSYSVAVSRDERLIAYGSHEKFLSFLEIATGREVAFWDKLPDDVELMSFSPDGRTLAWGGSSDPTVRVVEIASGKERRRFLGHRGRVTGLTFSTDGDMLVSGGIDTTAMVWDVTGRRVANDRQPLSPQSLDACWTDLAHTDAERAYRAVCTLANDPARAVPFLDQRLKPVAMVPDKHLARLIADLNSKDFPTRAKAAEELERLGELATPACRQAESAKPTLETRLRLQHILEVHKQQWRNPAPETMRHLRALEALERSATAKAVKTLERMAEGAAPSRVTIDAKASLDRLRPPPSGKTHTEK